MTALIIIASVCGGLFLILLLSAILRFGKKKKSRALGYTESNGVALELKDVTKIYLAGDNKVVALKDVNLAFRKNEFVSVLGPSGCGKTTMLNIVGGLDRYTSGDVLIGGKSTKQYKDADWDTYRNNSIGFVFQTYNLIMHQSVISNVEMALTLSGVKKEERRRRAKEVLKQVGLEGQEHKKPNQLSGGQMQRVAIARALVNNPEIILADEPTGALDTETSIQIMELLKEVAKDKLVIMVTHNPDLANRYSTRIINLLDGEVTGDTNKFIPDLESKKHKKVLEKNKSAMSFGTALKLSMSNLRTKKGRTALTSIAGSIGIIGIAMVLGVSTGFSGYINDLQANTLSTYPLTISESSVDLTDFEKLLEQEGLEQFPKLKEVYTQELFKKLTGMLRSNNLSDEYRAYVEDYVLEQNDKAEKNGEGWKYSLSNDYGFDMNNFIYSNLGYYLGAYEEGTSKVSYNTVPVDMFVRIMEDMFSAGLENSELNMSTQFVREYIPTMSEMPKSLDLIKSQYDLLDGDWATEEDELMLVVNKTNTIPDISLAFLGIKTIEGSSTDGYNIVFGGKDTFTFDDIFAKKFYYINNDTRYTKVDGLENTYYERGYAENKLPDGTMELKIKGIVRVKENIEQGVLMQGIAYTHKLTEKVLADNLESQIVKGLTGDQKATIYPIPEKESPMMPNAMIENLIKTGALTSVLKLQPIYSPIMELAGRSKPIKLSIYSVDYQAKEDIKVYLDAWNEVEDRKEEDIVHYSDASDMLFSAMNMIVDGVKIVLIAFTSISLVVSSIMIGIITYVSVVERTKEIGVLRSLGARKKDVSRIFNAETFIIGLLAGIIGIGFTYLISIPINIFVGGLIGAKAICSLRVTDAIVLVIVSFILTLISGLIPARIAAKKDPVVALRTE